MVFSLILTWYFVKLKIPLKLDNGTIIKSVVASSAMALGVQLLQMVYYSRFLLPLYFLAGAALYLVAIRALRAATTTDIDLIRQVLGPRFNGLCDLLSHLVVLSNRSLLLFWWPH